MDKEKLYYPVHYNDYADGRFLCWLGEPKMATNKPSNTFKSGSIRDEGTDWFESREEAIKEIDSQGGRLIYDSKDEYKRINW